MTPAIGPILIVLGIATLLPGWPRKAALQRWISAGAGALVVVLVALLTPGDVVHVRFWGTQLTLVEVTSLRLVFAWAFAISLFAWGFYAWKKDDLVERGAGLIYAGSAFGVLFAGDLLTLFLFSEGMALASTVVIFRGGTRAASDAALRYLFVHLLGGVLLMTGIALVYADTGSWAFGPLALDSVGPWLVFLSFLVNAAAWPLSAWLPDSYPRATPAGMVLLGTFTTKTAVYVLVAAFAGSSILLLLGAAMALYAVVYALGTRNYRLLLAYSLVGQVGYMLCAAGAGGTLGVSGAASHALMHVLYKSLLFMAAGVVFVETGKAVGGGFGGLWRKMPWTFGLAAVGAASIAALPLTNAFVSKSLILDAVYGAQGDWARLAETVLLIASAAAPLYVSLRFLWLAFSGSDEDASTVAEAADAPLSQRIAMGILAFLCLFLGLWPKPVLDLLPVDQAHLHVFTAAHVGKQLLLLGIGTMAFLLWRAAARWIRIPHPDPLPDTDAVYLRLVSGFVWLVKNPLMRLFARLSKWAHEDVPEALGFFARNPAGYARLAFERVRLAGAGLVGSPLAIDRAQARFERQFGLYRQSAPATPWPIGRTVLYGVLLLAVYVLLRALG